MSARKSLTAELSVPGLPQESFDAVTDVLIAYYAHLALVEAARAAQDAEGKIALARAVLDGLPVSSR